MKVSIGIRMIIVLVFVAISSPALVSAQDEGGNNPQELIDATPPAASDTEIEQRIASIFIEIEALSNVTVNVTSGVVTLSGTTINADAAARAEAIASRIAGVVTVENSIKRDVSVDSRLSPALDEAQGYVFDVVRSAPLLLVALGVFLAISILGWVLSIWRAFWHRIMPNAFIAEIAATTTRVIFIVLGAIAALSLLGATALLGAFLGAAGVLGLAVGFAVRDTIENYIASIMLSLRQPFRPNDLVKIDEKEGRVIRLTSRATILMTLDGNHLRIPNAAVFKAVILNYTRNSERRFEFELGVDAADDPLAAIETGLNALNSLDFILRDPPPLSFIHKVGDSNIVLFFGAWIDQNKSDYAKSRSVALSTVKTALEDDGFALPEPIYRLRFDNSAPAALKEMAGVVVTETDAAKDSSGRDKKAVPRAQSSAALDTAPDLHIAEKVAEERAEAGDEDLLSDSAPTE